MDQTTSQVEAGLNRYFETADTHFWEVPPITPHLKQLFNTDTSDDDDNESGIYNDSFNLENGSVPTPPPPNSDELRLPSLDTIKTPKHDFVRRYSVGESPSEFEKFVPGDSSVRSNEDPFDDVLNMLSDDLGKTPDHCSNMGKTPEHFAKTSYHPVDTSTLEDLIDHASPVRCTPPPVELLNTRLAIEPSSLSPTPRSDTPKSLEALKSVLDLDNVLNAGVTEEDYQKTVIGALRDYLGDDSDKVIDKLIEPKEHNTPRQRMPINPEELKRRLNELIADNQFKLNRFSSSTPKASPKTKNIVFKKPSNSTQIKSMAQKVHNIAPKPPKKSHKDSLYQQLRSIEDSQLEFAAKIRDVKAKNNLSKALNKTLSNTGFSSDYTVSSHNGTSVVRSPRIINIDPTQNNLNSLKVSSINVASSSKLITNINPTNSDAHKDITIKNQYPKMKNKTKQESIKDKSSLVKKDVIMIPPNSTLEEISIPANMSAKNKSVFRNVQEFSKSIQNKERPNKIINPSSIRVKQDPNKKIVVVEPMINGTVSKVVSTVRPKTSLGKGSILKLSQGSVAPGQKFVLVPVNSLNRTPQILDKLNNITMKRSLESQTDTFMSKKPKQISFIDSSQPKISDVSQLEEVNPFQFTGQNNNSMSETIIDQAKAKRKAHRSNQTAFTNMQTFLADFVQQNNEQVMEILFLKENNATLTEKYEELQDSCKQKEVEYKKVKEDIRMLQLQNNRLQKDLDKITNFITSIMKKRWPS